VDASIGQRLRALRTERRPKLTQAELAERAGVSTDLIAKLEQGRKKTARISSLTLLARALDVTLPELLSGPRVLDAPLVAGEGIQAVRRALSPIPGSVEDAAAEEINVSVADAWSAYWSGEYDVLAALIPPLLASTTGDEKADAYRAAASLLVHLGHVDLAYLALERAQECVTGDLLGASILATLSWHFLCTGRPEDGATLAVRAADDIEPRRLPKASSEHLSVRGNALVRGATAAARAGDADYAHEIMRSAGAAAALLGEDRNDFETAFGPAQVAMQSVDIAVVTEDFSGALKAARTMPPDPQLPLAARARHLADLAHAHTQLGHDSQAEQILLAVERMAPRWIHYQDLPKRIVADLVERERPVRTPGLRGLAHRLGVA